MFFTYQTKPCPACNDRGYWYDGDEGQVVTCSCPAGQEYREKQCGHQDMNHPSQSEEG